MKTLKAPFPWYGGKSRVASLIWNRFGDVAHYVEPFAGSLAVLLGRPHTVGIPSRSETVNDLDRFICNFWRAIQMAPDRVAEFADWPINETDLHARHRWLVKHGLRRLEGLERDPCFFDAQVAGWWVWGICQWIGGGWCAKGGERRRPALTTAGQGVHRQIPRLHDSAVKIVREHTPIRDWMEQLAERLRHVRVCCGDWRRVLTGAVINDRCGRPTGIFLDPPYSHKKRDKHLYREDNDVAADVRQWAIEQGHEPLLRIAVCGLEGEHEFPDGWHQVAWKANGAGNMRPGRGRENAARERIWFSPGCLTPATSSFATQLHLEVM